jgi:lysozyme
MNISSAGQKLIEQFEGREARAYLDSAGLWTIGVGHLIKADEQHLKNATLSNAEIDALFRQDISWAEDAVRRLFPRIRHQSQFDALVSFVFNLGEGATKSGTLDDLVNENASPEQISAKWMQYVFAGGSRVNGLVKRRSAELAHYWSYLWRTACLFLVFAAALMFTTGILLTA